MTELAQRIQQRRRALRLSQEELGFRIGVSQNQISHYEIGKNEPGAAILDALADALGVTTDWLLGRTEIPDKPLRGAGDLDEWEIATIQALRAKSPDQRKRIVEIIKLLD